MDKYELNLKIEQIKKLAAKKSYKEAAAIAKDMNWQKVKDWSTLATVINVQEAVGDYEEARDMAILAYNRNLGGRKLVYKLTELLIKLKDFDNAQELYEEYEKMSSHDVNRFILYYDLRKAQHASDNELVEILEDYKENEIDEKYMYELACLYSRTGRRDECIKTCDDIVLWFQDGIYVEKAIQLKQEFGAVLTNTQKKILEAAINRKEDMEQTKEVLFEQQKELARIRQDDIEEALNENDEPQMTEAPEIPPQEEVVIPESEEEEEAASGFGVSYEKTSLVFAPEEDTVKPETQPFVPKVKEQVMQENEKTAAAHQTAGQKASQMPETLRELIANAKKKIENSYDQIHQEEEAERQKEEREDVKRKIREREDAIDIEVDVPNYSIYDTQNIQAELAKNLSELLLDEEEVDAEVFRPQPVAVPKEAAEETASTAEPEDEQIEGQLSLADWIETVREEKYGKQNTREYSKAELDRLLDEKDEKSAAYERLVAEQKAIAKAQGTEFNEAEAKIKARTQMMLHAAKTDLAIRTGKATLKLEEAVMNLKEAAREAQAVNAQTQPAPEQEYTAAREELFTETPQRIEPLPETDRPSAVKGFAKQDRQNVDMVSLNTAPIEPVTKEILENMQRPEPMMEETNSHAQKTDSEEAFAEAAVGELFEPERPRKIKPEKVQKEETAANAYDFGEAEEEKKLTGDLAKIFRRYREMPGLENQLAEYFDSIDAEMQITTSEVGNIIISGNSSSDKTDLARMLVRAINHLYPDNPKKIAKTTGDSINHRGIAKAMGKLRGTALIVEGAGSIQPKRVSELLACLEQETDRMLVIFEDSDAEMNVLMNFNPELAKKFNHRIVLKQYTVNELVEMARKFARKRQYEVDDSALLELYLKIDKLHNINDNIKLDDVKEIINQAIEHSERRASRRLFGGLKKKRSENGDIFFLSEADFKD